MSTEEFEDMIDSELVKKEPALVHRESIAGLSRMNTMQRKDISRRITQNDDITRAKARQASRAATKVGTLTRDKISRMNSIVNNYHVKKTGIEDGFIKRLKELGPTKPVEPKLFTKERAAVRGTRNLLDSARANNKWQQTITITYEPFNTAVKHEIPWSFQGTRVRKQPYEPSIMEPGYRGPGTESPERLRLRQRPWSAATLKPVKVKERGPAAPS